MIWLIHSFKRDPMFFVKTWIEPLLYENKREKYFHEEFTFQRIFLAFDSCTFNDIIWIGAWNYRKEFFKYYLNSFLRTLIHYTVLGQTVSHFFRFCSIQQFWIMDVLESRRTKKWLILGCFIYSRIILVKVSHLYELQLYYQNLYW